MSNTMSALLGALTWACILALPLAAGLLIWSIAIVRKSAKNRRRRGKFEA